jgi:hypothetical protein
VVISQEELKESKTTFLGKDLDLVDLYAERVKVNLVCSLIYEV